MKPKSAFTENVFGDGSLIGVIETHFMAQSGARLKSAMFVSILGLYTHWIVATYSDSWQITPGRMNVTLPLSMTLSIHDVRNDSGISFLNTLAAGIARLTTFNKVVVGLVPVDAKCLPRDLLVDYGKRAEIWGVLKEKLEPNLGPWKVIGGTDEVDGLDGELVFHPVECCSSPVHEKCIFESKLGTTNRSDDPWLALQSSLRGICL